VVTRNQSRKSSKLRRGGISIQMLVILVPVIFGFMGFAVDLGRLYLVKGELNQAASAMAMAAAKQLNGTDQAVDAADGAAQSLLDDSLHDASRYNFGSIVIGQPTLALTSTVAEPALFATVADAIAAQVKPERLRRPTARPPAT
jgi:Flp pilus assembly protein TadG